MLRFLVIASFGLCACEGVAPIDESEQSVKDENGLTGAPEHLHLSKDFAGKPAGGGRVSSPVMTSHGGTVLITNKTQAIFWGNWSNPGDKIDGVDSFFQG